MDETPTLRQILDNLNRQVAILVDRVDMLITHNQCSSPSTPAAITPISPPSVALNPSYPPPTTLKTTTLPMKTYSLPSPSPISSINKPAPSSLPLPSNPTTLFSTLPSKQTLPSSYPIKHLTYSEMQKLRGQGLCLNCNNIDGPTHRCPIKTTLLVVPDEYPNIEQQSMGTLNPAVLKASQPQYAVFHDSVPPTPPYAASFEIESTTHQFDEILCLDVGGFRKVYKGDIDGDVEIKRGKPISNQIQPDQFPFGFVLFEVLCVGPAINPTKPNEQKFSDAHNVVVEMHKLKCESKVLVFDPGGTFNIGGIFDLEDKVVFKGSVMKRLGVSMLQEVCTLYEE